MPKKINFTEEQEKEIVRLYEEDLINPKKIGEIFRYGRNTIVRILKKLGKHMNLSNRRKLLFKEGKIKNARKIDFTKEQREDIVKKYLIDLEAVEDIGKILNYSFDTIKRILIEERVYMESRERRKLLIKKGKFNPSLNLGEFGEKGHISHNKGKTKENYEPLRKLGEAIKGRKAYWLTKRNLENNPMNNLETRKKSSRTQLNKFKDKDYKARFLKTNRGIFEKGENHPYFNNWSSLLPYDKKFNDKFKRFIRERDGCCLLCNVSFEDLRLLKRQINVHHINYDKKLSIPQNCATLCNPCHSKTNTNRPHWTKFFQSLLAERYGYKYNENKEIVLEIKNV